MRPRVLVIYKKSAFHIHVRDRRDQRITQLLAKQHPSVERLREAHEDHLYSLQQARRTLKALNTNATFKHRSKVTSAKGYDLVVTLGGDGTLLSASHAVDGDTPVVAINTAPEDSVGFYCAGDKYHISDVLGDALAGRLRAFQLTRMQVDIDDKTIAKRVLNDALFCHSCPAAITRYFVVVKGVREDQKSSGIWIGPAAGSTAAQHSAGGKILPVGSKALQFVVREPYEPTGRGYRFTRGLIRPGENLEIHCKVQGGRVFLDGPHKNYPVTIGKVLTMRRSPEPFTLLGFHR